MLRSWFLFNARKVASQNSAVIEFQNSEIRMDWIFRTRSSELSGVPFAVAGTFEFSTEIELFRSGNGSFSFFLAPKSRFRCCFSFSILIGTWLRSKVVEATSGCDVEEAKASQAAKTKTITDEKEKENPLLLRKCWRRYTLMGFHLERTNIRSVIWRWYLIG